MRLLPILLFSVVCIAAFPDSYDEDEEIDESPHSKPRVAWVPIVQRNVTTAVGEALQGDDERLGRIGKMLGDSYDQWSRHATEGDLKIRQLEEQGRNGAPILLLSFPTLLLSFNLF